MVASRRRMSKMNMSKRKTRETRETRKTRGKRYKQRGGFSSISKRIREILLKYGDDLPFGHAMNRNVIANRMLNEIEEREGRQLNGAETENEVLAIRKELDNLVSRGIIHRSQNDLELFYIP
jgi:hypothetical protein